MYSIFRILHIMLNTSHSPEGVVGLGKLGDLEIPHLQVADIIHGDFELHRHRPNLSIHTYKKQGRTCKADLEFGNSLGNCTLAARPMTTRH